MAPKRRRRESSSTSLSYDSHRFVSEAASERFHIAMVAKSIIPERGIRPDFIEQEQLCEMIMERHWETFVQQPEPAVENIVREFYANAIAVRNNVIRVRGNDVSFSAEAINQYYNINAEPGIDEYSQYKHSNPNFDELIQALCRTNATWTFRGAESIYFAAKDLSRFGKAWYYFLCAKLMPTTHLSEIIKDRAMLLYCLVKGKTINVGQVINKSIKNAIDGGSTSGLPHPSLICGLCAQAEVTWAADEKTQLPKILLDDRIIRKLKQWEGAPADPRGAGFIVQPPVMEDPHSPDTEELFGESPPHSHHEAGTTSRAPSTTAALTENEFSIKLRRMQTNVDSQLKTIALQNKSLAQRQGVMHEYNVEVAKALAQAFSTIQFPNPPALPDYPAASSSDAADDGDS